MMLIDLNSDLGEGFGPWAMGQNAPGCNQHNAHKCVTPPSARGAVPRPPHCRARTLEQLLSRLLHTCTVYP